jgi:hypothetical protein
MGTGARQLDKPAFRHSVFPMASFSSDDLLLPVVAQVRGTAAQRATIQQAIVSKLYECMEIVNTLVLYGQRGWNAHLRPSADFLMIDTTDIDLIALCSRESFDILCAHVNVCVADAAFRAAGGGVPINTFIHPHVDGKGITQTSQVCGVNAVDVTWRADLSVLDPPPIVKRWVEERHVNVLHPDCMLRMLQAETLNPGNWRKQRAARLLKRYTFYKMHDMFLPVHGEKPRIQLQTFDRTLTPRRHKHMIRAAVHVATQTTSERSASDAMTQTASTRTCSVSTMTQAPRQNTRHTQTDDDAFMDQILASLVILQRCGCAHGIHAPTIEEVIRWREGQLLGPKGSGVAPRTTTSAGADGEDSSLPDDEGPTSSSASGVPTCSPDDEGTTSSVAEGPTSSPSSPSSSSAAAVVGEHSSSSAAREVFCVGSVRKQSGGSHVRASRTPRRGEALPPLDTARLGPH